MQPPPWDPLLDSFVSDSLSGIHEKPAGTPTFPGEHPLPDASANWPIALGGHYECWRHFLSRSRIRDGTRLHT